VLRGTDGPVSREDEAELYDKILCERYADPERILANAGTWIAARVAV
jgi:asparagine synthase (glutamine-hydrolysing)